MIRIDVLDASDNKIGEGPLQPEEVTIRRSLDKVGGCDFPVAAVEPKVAVIGAGRKYQIFHAEYGLLGTFRHASQSLGAASDKPMLRVKADDQLIELVHKNGYFRRNFNHTAVESVVSTLLSVAGWTDGGVETEIGSTTVSYEGESIFEALDVLRDRWGRHFRLGSIERTLDFGALGESSGVRLIRPESIPREMEQNGEVAFIAGLEITEESEAVVNRLIPVGAGAGTTQLTLQYVTAADTAYPVQSGSNADGSLFYYIEDGDSQTAYGLVERPFERNDIRPLTNSTPDLQNAANALYNAALAALLKWKSPRSYYSLTATKLDPRRLKPGEQVRVVFRGVAQAQGRPYKWVDVDADLWVMDIEESYSSAGQQSVRLEVATSDTRRTSDSDVLAKLTRDTKVFKTHVQPNLTHSPTGPYVKRMDATHTARFNVRLKSEVLAINRAILRFQTSSLRSSVTSVAAAGSTIGSTQAGGGGSQTSNSGGGSSQSSNSQGSHTHEVTVYGGNPAAAYDVYWDPDAHRFVLPSVGSGEDDGQTSSSEGSHNHSINIPSHTHNVNLPSHNHDLSIPAHGHAMSYGLFEDSAVPQNIRVAINGVDRTAALGGPWSTGGGGGGLSGQAVGPVDIEKEITAYLNRGQDNTVTFSCSGGRGEVTCLVECLLTIQAIVVT
jgi:hypothetical protein